MGAARRWLPALALASLAGCPSFSSLHTARALDKGDFQVTVAPEVIGITSTANTPGGALPGVDIALRAGVADGLDLGLKLFPIGLEFESTIQLIKGGPLDLALAPGVSYIFGVGSGETVSALTFYLPLLFGLNFGDGHQFVFGPKIIPDFIFTSGSSTNQNAFALFAGGTVGLSLKLGPTFRIMPEVNVFAPLSTNYTSNGTNTVNGFGSSGAVVFNGAIGFAFGPDGFGGSPKPAPPAPGYVR
jgi:hypothetical protein